MRPRPFLLIAGVALARVTRKRSRKEEHGLTDGNGLTNGSGAGLFSSGPNGDGGGGIPAPSVAAAVAAVAVIALRRRC